MIYTFLFLLTGLTKNKTELADRVSIYYYFPMNKSEQIYDYIVIGSGFGGSVSACRLSEKGYSVLVLEQGKRKHKNDYAKSNWNAFKYLWAPLFKCFGIQKLNFFKDVLVLSGVGVGGGSLVYANTHMVPDDHFFKNKAWAHLGEWKSTLMPFYALAKHMLGTVENPIISREDEYLKEVATDLGAGDSWKTTDVGIYFGEMGEEVDPYFGGEGPLRNACTECAGCMVGCRYNAKNTLDKNYLWFAEKNGTQIEAERKVTDIGFENGLYSVTAERSTSWYRKNKQVYKAKGLVISAGVLGTLKLLLAQKLDNKSLAKISDKLASNVRTNSEMIAGAAGAKVKINNGIAISSVIQADEHTHVEICKYPTNSGAMGLLAVPAVDETEGTSRKWKLIRELIFKPGRSLRWLTNKDFSKNSVFILVMQSVDNSMKMRLKKGLFGRKLIFDNKGEEKIPAYIPIGQEVTHRYAEKIDGFAENSTLEVLQNMSTTAHILGGCPMGATVAEGVVDNRFQVHNYPNMYILDGSIIPCNLGVNPSLTITTLSEYAMNCIPPKKENVRHIGYETLESFRTKISKAVS